MIRQGERKKKQINKNLSNSDINKLYRYNYLEQNKAQEPSNDKLLVTKISIKSFHKVYEFLNY